MSKKNIRSIIRKTLSTTFVTCLGCLLLPTSLAAQQDPPLSVSGPQISALIRNIVIAVHQANITGNYTVLRDLGSASFSYGRSAATLADIFRPLREGQIDLADTILQDPLMSEQPKLSAHGMLQLKGWFPRERENVTFDLTFRYEDDTWRIMSISMGVEPIVDSAASNEHDGTKGLSRTKSAEPATTKN